MQLQLLDWVVIVVYCVIVAAISLLYSRRANRNKESFFVAGRRLNWFVAGTSMAAAYFASDTPLVVSGLVRKEGIYANWIWWTLIFSGMSTFFFFSRFWRRSGMLTDVQFIDFRYSGKEANGLRIFQVFFNVFGRCITIAWVMIALYKIFFTLFGFNETVTVSLNGQVFYLSTKLLLIFLFVLLSLFYTVIAGFWGVAVTDVLHFTVAMAGAIILAIIAVCHAGGPTNIVNKILESPGVTRTHISFFPAFSKASDVTILTFIIFVFIYWLPKATGDSNVVQRLLACKDEVHASLSTLWGFFAIVVIRSWPWIIVGLVSLIYFPLQESADHEFIYPKMMAKFLPVGLKGLMLVSFLAAFLSTVNGILTLSASYLVNDVYMPFICKNQKSEKHYVMVSRFVIVLVLIISTFFAIKMDSILSAWKYFAEIVAGTSFVLIARWYWWRINAWSEISAMTASLIIANTLRFIPGINEGDYFAIRFAINLLVSTAVCVVVTFVAKPTSHEKLKGFYDKIKPVGWWKPFYDKTSMSVSVNLRGCFIGWVFSVVSLYSSLFGIGYICLGYYAKGILLLVVFVIFSKLTLKKMRIILK